MRVLILGGRAPVALDHARRFAAQGWSVGIADSAPCRLSAWSRAVDSVMALPPPRQALPEFAAQLARVISTQRIDLVLPTCEEVFYVSRVRSQLPATCSVFAAPFEQLRELHSKWRFLTHARHCGVNVPPAARVPDLAAAREWAGDRPVVLKPEFSRFGVHVRVHPGGIPAAAPPLPAVGPWLVQAFQAGRELCSYGIACDGRLTAHVAYEPSYRLPGSSSYFFEPRVVPRIEAFVATLVERTRFTGQIAFDWILGDDGELSVLECNPRASSGLHLFDRAAPLPAAICDPGTARVTPWQPAPRMIASVMLAVGMPAAIRAGRLRRWHADWRRASDVLAIPGDGRPALGACCDLASYVGRALRAGCSVRAATTRDIEWDGEPLHA
jgi:hypothetical protein